MVAYDYSRVADLYDTFCVFDGDVAFWQNLTREIAAPVLELMAGTGRVSLPLVAQGVRLTCVDRHASMLTVLSAKLRAQGLAAQLVCGDVCALPFVRRFELVVLPFQGFSELITEREQAGALDVVAALLAPGGRFVCTSHNPAMRSRTIDGAWHQIAELPDRDGGRLALHLQTWFAEGKKLARGHQKIERFDAHGERTEERIVDLEFSLVSATRLEELAERAGLRLREIAGDYAGAVFDETSSPCIIATFERRR